MSRITFFLIGLPGVVGILLWSALVPGARAEQLSAPLLRDAADPTSEFIVSIWKTGEGLPSNEIEDIKETPDGFLWLGTFQGLARFDGVRFQSFFTTPTGLRYGKRIGPLELDARGRLWFAPDQSGLIYLENGVFTEVLTNETVLKSRAESLCSDGTNGMMWVDSSGKPGRVSIEEPEQAESIKGGGSNSRWLRDSDGKLWLASPRNLKIYQGENWRNIPMPGNGNMAAAPRMAGGLWIARDARLWFVTADGKSREVTTFPWKNQSRVTCLMEDGHERLWIGTAGRGLFCYSAGEFKQVVPIASAITCLFEDGHDNVWAGTRGGGLVRVRKRQFFMHDLSSGLKNEFVRSVSQDHQGRIWLVSGEGEVGWWQNGGWRSLSEADGWPRHDSLSVLPRRDGSVWISTHRGMWRWLDGKFTKRELGPKTPKEPVVDLLEDKVGRLWMVTDNLGIFCLDGDKLTRYSTPEGLPSNLIRCIVEDETGELWAGDWEGGVSRFRDGRWEVVRKSSGHGDAIRSMVASKGVLWIGTSAGGLLRLKDGQTSRVSVEQGLPDNSIQQLLLDGRGSLWGGTAHKLFRVSLEQLNAVMDGRLEKIGATTYGRSDGLPDVSFATWCDPRCWQTTNGELWFATANGAIHFQPGNLPESKTPQVQIEQTLVDGKPVEPAALKHLRPGLRRLEFRFTAPCLTAPERVRFRYQLVGVDSDWVDGGTARAVTYASIPPGKHIFRVLASSPEGVWGSKPATLALAIHPYFWQTAWFLAVIVAAVTGGGVWSVRRATVQRLNRRLERLRQQRVMDQERARIAQDIHDELGANLTSIGLLADLGARHKFDSSKVGRELKQISQTARESVAAMDAIVWAINPRNDSLDHFANYIAQFTREFFRPTELRTRLELPANLPEHPLATETRHQLFLIVKESFNNIVRHAEATEVNLELACDDRHLRLVIADNGKGLSSKTVDAGQNGLVNLRERIERLGGTLHIESKNGSGSKLEFVLPLTRTKSN